MAILLESVPLLTDPIIFAAGQYAENDVEENWLAHVDRVTNQPSNKGLLSTFGAFSKLFEELKVGCNHF